MRTARGRGCDRVRDSSGAVAVEFALILPILLILVFGIINFGYLFGQQLSLNQAVREGTRKAVVKGSGVVGSSDIESAVENAVGPLINPKQDVGVTPSSPTGCEGLVNGDDLTVVATYTASPLALWFLPLPDEFALTSTAVFRCEWGGTG